MSHEKNETIAEQIEEFEKLLAWFDGEDFKLEEAIDKYKEAEQLAAAIESRLSEIKNEVTVLKQKFSE